MDAFENMSVSNHPGGNARRNSQSANEMLASQIQDFQNIPRSFNDSNANVNLSKNFLRWAIAKLARLVPFPIPQILSVLRIIYLASISQRVTVNSVTSVSMLMCCQMGSRWTVKNLLTSLPLHKTTTYPMLDQLLSLPIRLLLCLHKRNSLTLLRMQTTFPRNT